MVSSPVTSLSGALLLLGTLPGGVAEYKVDSRDAIVEASRSLARDMMTFYHGDEPEEIPGILPGPPPMGDYWWFTAASFWATCLDYWHLTGDDTYQGVTTSSLLFQVGPTDNYMTLNWTATLGNDEQCFWGSAALLAAEYDVPTPEGEPRWIDIAENVWGTQAHPDRHDDTCGGGLRWQILPSNNRYDYKNTLSNACFFTMGARLARFTGNETFADYSVETWDWLTTVGLVDTETWAVYDGAMVDDNCTKVEKTQFSQNAAMLTQGAAFMYNFTNGSDAWRERAEKLSDAMLKTFFPDGIAYEVACEGNNMCTTDMLFMKGYAHRWLASATQMAPFLAEKVLPVLQTSAEAAAKQCEENSTDGDDGAASQRCGFYWRNETFVDVEDSGMGNSGAAEGISVFAAVSNLLISEAEAPATAATLGDAGNSTGTSEGGSSSGTSGEASPSGTAASDSGASRYRAEIMVSMLLGVVAMFAWAV
ncbi:glycoside hydrolase family 76 [Diaporthe helianthi]|uniref:Mannan endo-1,6-alpha-mannosidase n=1 Tax=Diaporthe helianthi TaxID=158607 RepID=A0A2P5HTA3_DIAHE|nr:glycoside hydrolase family 76 [Diaporthe helianthi]